MDRKRVKRIVRKLGTRLMFFITINFYIIVVVAMFNNDSAIVLFNHFNEAHIEYIIYTILAPIILYSFIADLLDERRMRKEKKRKKNANYSACVPSGRGTD